MCINWRLRHQTCEWSICTASTSLTTRTSTPSAQTASSSNVWRLITATKSPARRSRPCSSVRSGWSACWWMEPAYNRNTLWRLNGTKRKMNIFFWFFFLLTFRARLYGTRQKTIVDLIFLLTRFQNYSRARHFCHWFIKRVSYRHADSHSWAEIPERGSNQRIQRLRHARLDGSRNSSIADSHRLGLFRQSVRRDAK